jgi:hypothetical protein
MEDRYAIRIPAAFNQRARKKAESIPSYAGKYAHVRKGTVIRSGRSIDPIHRKGSDRLDQEPERFELSVVGSRNQQEL